MNEKAFGTVSFLLTIVTLVLQLIGIVMMPIHAFAIVIMASAIATAASYALFAGVKKNGRIEALTSVVQWAVVAIAYFAIAIFL